MKIYQGNELPEPKSMLQVTFLVVADYCKLHLISIIKITARYTPWFLLGFKNWAVEVFLLQATAEANNLSAVANAKDLYTKEMEKVQILILIVIVIILKIYLHKISQKKCSRHVKSS